MTPIEAIHLSLVAIEKHLGDCAEAVHAQSEALESAVVGISRLEDVVAELASKVGQLYDATNDLNGRFGSYLAEVAKDNATARVLRSEVREVDRRLRLLEGGGGGQR